MTVASKKSDTKTNAAKNDRNNVEELFQSYLEEAALLPNENKDVFRKTVEAITEETGATSFLARLAALDFVEKYTEERRWKAATAETIKGERSKVKMFASEDEQECEAIERYLQKVMKLDRMISHSQAGRRALLKELRQFASNDTPPLAPED